MELRREAVATSLSQFVDMGGGVVIGAPGVGKTHLLKEFCEKHLDRGGECLYLPLDKLGANSESELQAELGLRTDLPTYLAEETAKSLNPLPRILVLDAFDAARSAFAQQFVIRLIRRTRERVGDTWRIIVSARSYDAKRSLKLQGLFPESNAPAAEEYRDSEIRCRHFVVPALSPDEVRDAVATIEGFGSVFERASREFKALMSIPFNLWLAESLFQHEAGAALSEVNTEVQLLSLFWEHRVNRLADPRESTVLLTRITATMVQRRTLAVRIADVYPAGAASSTWDALLSSEVLENDAQPHRQRISFSHNILFDYAVSVLLIEDEPTAAMAFLAEDPSRPLFLRPSVDYFFTRLWDTAPNRFWDVLWFMFEAPEQVVRIYARLVPAIVMAREGREPSQFEPLLTRIRTSDSVASSVFLSLLQTVRGLFAGSRDRLWIQVLQVGAQHLQSTFAWELGALTFDILERNSSDAGADVVQGCGEAGRRILSWALGVRREKRSAYSDNVGAIWGVRLVARTFATNRDESRLLLQDVMEQVTRPDFPIDYFSRLTDEIKYVWPHDPNLAIAVYELGFRHEEESDAKTSFGTPILPLTSTRRQDFRMCQYHLTQEFSRFIADAPVDAARAAVRAINEFVLDRHVLRYLKRGFSIRDVSHTFEFRNRQAAYVQDLSYSWDASLHSDEPMELASHLFQRIDALASAGETQELDRILDVFADDVRVAFWWKRLLETGARHPALLGPRLFQLAVAAPVLENLETLHSVGRFIEEAFKYLETPQRRQLELQILAISEVPAEAATGRRLTERRDRLLSRIPNELLVTAEAQRIRAELEVSGLTPNEPLVRFSVGSGRFSEEDFLKEQGAEPDRSDNKGLLDATQPLDDFHSAWQNKRPSIEAIAGILPVLQSAFDAVQQATTVDTAVQTTAWTRITAAAETIAKGDISPDSVYFATCKAILLAGLRTATKDEVSPDRDETYTHASWSPGPVTNAAEGLPWLARLTRDEEIMVAIEGLSSTPEPSVRFLVVREAFRFAQTAGDVFWRIAEDRAKNERNAVVQDSLARCLWDVFPANRERALDLLQILTKRVVVADSASEVSETLTSIILVLAFVHGDEWATNWTKTLLAQPIEYSNSLHHAVSDTALRYVLPSNLGERKEAFARSLAWLSLAIEASIAGMKKLEESSQHFDEPTANLYKRLYGAVDQVVLRIRFAFRAESMDGTDAQRTEFYWAVKPLLEQIAGLGRSKGQTVSLAASTAHHFMEFLHEAVDIDPAGVLHLAAAVGAAAEHGGYHLDGMAARETVALAERIVADYRSELRRPEVLADLLSLLDLFAKVGWREALNLLWRLEEIFR